MQHIFKYWKIYSLIRRILLFTFLGLVALIIIIVLLLRVPSVQNWVADKGTTYLSEKLDTRVEVKQVSIDIFNHLVLEGFYIEDHKQDTLLYAGKLEINIGSINPFSKKAKLKNISLSDSYINIYKSADSVFNFAFILDAFKPTAQLTDADTTPTKSKNSSYDLFLNKITFDRTRFKMVDEVGFAKTDIYIDESEIFINRIDLAEHVLALEKIEFNNTSINLRSLFDTIPDIKPESFDTIHIKLGEWAVEATQLSLNNCSFSSFDENSESQTTGLNFGDLGFTNINVDISDILFSGDTLINNINQISLKDKSGFRVDTLRGELLLSPYEVTLKKLLIVTPDSKIRDQFSMSFNTFNDFDRFETEVKWTTNFVNSNISTKDIAYFVPAVAEYDANLKLNAKIYGSLDNLKARDFNASVDNIGGIKGTLDVKGLPNINETFVDLKLEPLYVNMSELDKLLGGNQIPENVLTLGTINYSGRVTGFVYNLVAYGDLNTDQGGVYSDINFRYDPKLQASSFTGKINTSALNVGVIAGEPELLGRVSMNATVDGSVGKNKDAEIKLDAQVNSIEFNKYTYSNIIIDGELKNRSFEGNFSVDDPNIVMAFNGIVDFADSLPNYDFKATVNRANLMQLNFYNQPIVFSTTATMSVTGKTIDDMVGSANFGDLILIKERNIYRLDTLVINSIYENNLKVITANSNLINFTISGDYDVSQLPNTVKNMVNYYTTGIADSLITRQSATYTIDVKNADPLMAIFYPDVKAVRNLTISGNINTVNNEFNTRIRVDKINYKNLAFDTLLLEARTADNKLEFFGKLNSSSINTTTKIPVLRIEGNFAQNNLSYNLKVGKDTDSNRINLFGDIGFRDSLIAFNILPSEIYFQNEKWDILPNNSLQYVDNNIIADNFTLSSGEKYISLTSNADEKYGTVLKLDVKNIPIGELAEAYILPGEEISGKLDAKATIANVLKAPSFFGGATINNLALNSIELGDLTINASMIQPNNKLKFNSNLSGENGFSTDGYYVFSDVDSIGVTVDLRRTKLLIVEPFMTGILSEMEGEITGKLEVEGPLTRPEMKGSLNIRDGGTQIDYLGVNYYWDELAIAIDKNKISIPKITITDRLKNTGTLEGEVTYSNFSNWNFIGLKLNSEHIILMETNAKQNPDFYGYAIGSIDASITGKLDALNIAVNTSMQEGTQVILPTAGSGNVTKHDFIRFIDKSDTIKITIDELNLSIVTIDLVLNATPEAEIKILLNSDGTEFLTGKGFGQLKIKANSLGTVDIDGLYRITEGLYDFSFQGLFRKPFNVVSGSTIKFNGDPFEADLDITAMYLAKNVLTSTLTGLDNQEKTNVNVLIKVTGKLGSPVIDFDIEIPKTIGSNNGEFQRKIQEIEADENELNKQVFGLLITNSFLPQDLSTFNAVSSTASSTMNDFVSNQLTTYFQSVLDQFLKDTEIDIGYDQIQTGAIDFTADQGKKIDVALQREINEKIIVKVGTTYYDFASGVATENTSSIAGDFEIEYLLSDDGRVRAKAFRISEYDAIIAKNDVKTGIGLSYTKDFDKIKELFQWGKKNEVDSLGY